MPRKTILLEKRNAIWKMSGQFFLKKPGKTAIIITRYQVCKNGRKYGLEWCACRTGRRIEST